MPIFKALQAVAFSLVIVLCIAVLANIPTALKSIHQYATNTSTSVLTIERGESPQDVNLQMFSLKQDDDFDGDLQYGSQAEVYKFGVLAQKAFAMRYISFNVSWNGLKNDKLMEANDWHLFLMDGGEPDYLSEVGVGEKFENGLLKMRLANDGEPALFLPQGETQFVLTANVLRDYESGENAKIEAFIPADGDFGWTHNLEFESWMTLDSALKSGADVIAGLPTENSSLQ